MIAAATNGWWYRSPLPGDKSLLAYHTDADLLPTAVRQQASSFFALASECPALKTLLFTSPGTQNPFACARHSPPAWPNFPEPVGAH